MPQMLTEDALGSPQNARFLATLSDYAYAPESKALPEIEAELGMTAKLISVDNTQVYVCYNDEHLVLAFRGSEAPTSIDGLKDWFITNAANLLIQPEGSLANEFAAAGVGARWHQGFVNAITKVWEPLYTDVLALQQEKERVLWVTGHSLGGALALLGSWLLFRQTMKPHQVYTFGGPMVGNQIVADAINREFSDRLFRYVNSPDPIPLLPMISLAATHFVHTGQLKLIGAESEAANIVEYLQQLVGGTVTGLMSGETQDKVWAAIKGRIDAHLLPDYLKLI